MSDDNDGGEYLGWRDGLPTKPDVDALLKQWPPDTIKPGEWTATDEQLVELLGSNVERRSNRYRTITEAWRRRLLRDHQVVVYRNKERGFYCPTAAQIYAQTHPAFTMCSHKLHKQLKHVSVSKPESELEKITQEHQGKLLYTSRRELRKTRMNLLPDTATKNQPKLSPPNKHIR
jgi:hypothetical protein